MLEAIELKDSIAREVLALEFVEGPTREQSRLNEANVGFALDKA